MSNPNPFHEGTLRFLFFGVQRPWKAVNGHPQPPQDMWELRSLPTGLTAWGPSFEEATERLQRTIDAAAAHAEEAGTSDVDWYVSEFKSMSEADMRSFADGWSRLAAEAQSTTKIERPKASKREYGALVCA